MTTDQHFIAGLPRSGSTLLSAILRQNERFHAAMTSPVSILVGAALNKMTGGEFGVLFDNEQRAQIMKAIFYAYHANSVARLKQPSVIFDTNRTWTSRMALINQLYPKAKVICCVRSIGWILDSVEVQLAKNPLQVSKIFNFQSGSSVYARAEILMNFDNGLIGLPWSTMREAWFGGNSQNLIVVPYDNLVRQPLRTLNSLYDALDQPRFEHDFKTVIYDQPEYDVQIGMPGLHRVRETVEYQDRAPIIPPDLFVKYNSLHFWEKSGQNPRGVELI